jgi:zinc transport system permease protein
MTLLALWSQIVSIIPFEWTQYRFMQHALLAVILVSPLFGLLGSMVVNNQMAFFSDAIGHSALTGIAFGVLLGISQPLWSMVIFSLLLAFVITWLRKHSRASTDSIIGLVMSIMVALGIAILSKGGGFARYSRYLIGDILSITGTDLLLLAVVLILFLMYWIFGFNRLLLVSINGSLARSRGKNVWLTHGIFAMVTALVVSISIQWIGILVINALLIVPATAARTITRSIRSYMIISFSVCFISGISGLIISFYLSIATGATIVLCSALCYSVIMVFNRLGILK